MNQDRAGGCPEPPAGDRRRTQTLQRAIAFTDAAVAIALTMLVLPLVDLADASTANQSVADLAGQHEGDILSFVASFLVIMLFWRAHRQLYEHLVDYDEVLLIINTLWVLMVVFLPFPTARLFVEARLRTDSAVFYLASMLAISLSALAQTWWVGRRPGLRAPEVAPPRGALLSTAALSAAFVVATLTALVSPVAGLGLLVALPAVQYLTSRVARPVED